MSSPASPSGQPRLTPDDALPPVQPPSMGFIVQLFVIPAVIVVIIVAIYVAFTWLAGLGQDPTSYVRDMQRNNANSWQAAHNLALEMRRNPQLAKDAALCKQLILLLDQHLDMPLPPAGNSAEMRDSELRLRRFLCNILGHFELREPVDVLIKAAQPAGNEGLEVRLAALEGLTRLASHFPADDPLQHPNLMPTLLQAADDSDARLHVWAAYALGIIGGDASLPPLKKLLTRDQPAEARYNAATGLARHGDAACLSVLEEMLDPEQKGAVENEPAEMRSAKRATVLINAIKASEKFLALNNQADVAELRAAVERLTQQDLTTHVVDPQAAKAIRDAAQKLLEAMDVRTAKKAA